MKEQRQITCNIKDWKAVLKLKKHFKAHNTNEVVEQLVFHYLNSGEIPEEKKQKILGARLYDMFSK